MYLEASLGQTYAAHATAHALHHRSKVHLCMKAGQYCIGQCGRHQPTPPAPPAPPIPPMPGI